MAENENTTMEPAIDQIEAPSVRRLLDALDDRLRWTASAVSTARP